MKNIVLKTPDELQNETSTAKDYILSIIQEFSPEIGIILGTGLGGLVKNVDIKYSISYKDIPYFPVSTVESHHGKLIFGFISGKKAVIMQGRFHLYEGYTMQEITFPIRVMHALGISALFLSNACGALNPSFKKGEVMIIEDHINLLGGSPLVGGHDPSLGVRFTDLHHAYSPRLIAIAEESCKSISYPIHRGVYVAVTGPNLETAAEYRMLRVIGADVVGMSTVPECIMARHCGIEVFGISIITDEGFPETLKPVSLSEMIEAAHSAEPIMSELVCTIISKM